MRAVDHALRGARGLLMVFLGADFAVGAAGFLAVGFLVVVFAADVFVVDVFVVDVFTAVDLAAAGLRVPVLA